VSYNITEPINVIFTSVKDLRDINELTGKPYSETQIVNIAHIMIANHNILQSDLCYWNLFPPQEHMWENFIDHFANTHTERCNTDFFVDELGYQSANAILA